MNDAELRAALEKHHGESYGWALSCCARSSVEAETVLQTVYLKVLTGRARFDGRASFRTWLFAVIRRTAADEWRRQLLRRMLLNGRPATATAAERPDEAVYRTELQQSVRDALTQLPRRQREVLQLVFYHDLSLAEAAHVMSVSLGSARTHYERGKKRLRVQMEGWRPHASQRESPSEAGIDAGRNDPQGIVSATEAGR